MYNIINQFFYGNAIKKENQSIGSNIQAAISVLSPGLCTAVILINYISINLLWNLSGHYRENINFYVCADALIITIYKCKNLPSTGNPSDLFTFTLVTVNNFQVFPKLVESISDKRNHDIYNIINQSFNENAI